MSITMNDLGQFKWNGVAVIKDSPTVIIIILYFVTLEEGVHFYEHFLTKHEVKFRVYKNPAGEYSFYLEFPDSEIGLAYESKMTEQNYPPLVWLKNPALQIQITVAEKTGGGDFKRYLKNHPLNSTINFN